MSPLTGVLSEAWDLYRRFAGHFLIIALVIYVITAVLVALLSLGKIPGAIIGDVISFAATYVVQASLIKAVQDVRDGRVDLDLSETVRAASPFILAGIGIAIAGHPAHRAGDHHHPGAGRSPAALLPQRRALIVGVAMDQLKPAAIAGAAQVGPSGGLLHLPPMPTWAMITVIAGWIIGWSAIGAWKMVTRDA